MEDTELEVAPALPAGPFATWLAELQQALDGGGDARVPCGACTACCTASQFVHVGPDEVDALAHIPPALLFPAPRMPAGHVLLGYDSQGRCPMLVDGGCSIYEHRPRTCRTYDCRVFPASGLDAADDGKPLIAARARRWQFAFPTAADREQHDAVRAAAAYLDAHRDALPGVPGSATGVAVLAVELHDVFLGDPGAAPTEGAVAAALRSRQEPR